MDIFKHHQSSMMEASFQKVQFSTSTYFVLLDVSFMFIVKISF